MSAVISLIVGAFGAFVGAASQHFFRLRSSDSDRREALVYRYLYEMQDAAESLLHRFSNLRDRSGRSVMSDEYYHVSTLYALGRVLGLERILTLEAVYPQIDRCFPKARLGSYLRNHRLDALLRGVGFHQYYRLSLAEAAIIRENGGMRIRSFTEFRENFGHRLNDPDQWLAPARSFVEDLKDDHLSGLHARLREQIRGIAATTEMIPEAEFLPLTGPRQFPSLSISSVKLPG
jgi:hypothetical protein